MDSVIIAFEKERTGERLRDIIETSGLASCILCRSASEIKRLVQEQRINAVICGYKLSDESAEYLFTDLPVTCEMLVLALQSMLDLISEEQIFKLPSPATRGDLLAAVQRLLQASHRAERYIRPNRDNSDQSLIEAAKCALQTEKGMTEEEAHRYLQRASMETGKKLVQVAQEILNGK